jgi:simple sugar transport system ATP-binding protein
VVVDTIPAAGATEEGLARMMVGREVLLRVDKQPPRPQAPLLQVEHLTVIDDRGLEAVRDVSLEVRAGEIVGLAGVDANGQSELIDAIAGLRHVKSGRIVLDGRELTNGSAKDALDAGLGHIPEDRHRRGLVLPFSLTENLALHGYRHAPNSRRGFLNLRAMAERARRLLREFDVRGGTPATPAFALSGGNQQKVVLAREIDGDPKVLIAAQPTRGLDVGAIEFVHRRLVEQRDAGRAVLLVSLELEEILSLSDRILVIYEGRIVGEFPPSATEEELGFAMTGGRHEEAA